MKSIVISILVASVFVGGAILFSSGSSDDWQAANVSIADGKQIIEIMAKGKYAPRFTTARANIPTVLKVKTRGTFDCTVALTVPEVRYNAMLPATGETLIEIPPQEPGSTVHGICAMGMYNFQVKFNY